MKRSGSDPGRARRAVGARPVDTVAQKPWRLAAALILGAFAFVAIRDFGVEGGRLVRHQPASGYGWRLLAEGARPPADAPGVVVAESDTALDRIWHDWHLPATPVHVEFGRESVFGVIAIESSSCPKVLTGIEADRRRSILWPRLEHRFSGIVVECTADAVPHPFVLAIEHGSLPAQPITFLRTPPPG